MTCSGEMLLRLLVWTSIAAGLIIDTAGLSAEKIQFQLGSMANVPGFTVGYLVASVLLYGLAYAAKRSWQNDFLATCFYRAAVLIEVVCQFLGFFIIYLVLSYICAASPMPYQDKEFVLADRFLHFDWLGNLAWVNAHGLIRQMLTVSYYSPMPQALVGFMLLAIAGQNARLFRVILVLMLAALVCIAIAALLPAQGFITYQHINLGDFPNLGGQLGVGYLQVPILEQLRAGTFHTLILTKCIGLICFPSFHASLGVILLWMYACLPWIRWPVAALNLCEIVSTPSIGTHYFVDTIAGVAIALGAIYSVGMLGRGSVRLPAVIQALAWLPQAR